MNFLFEINTTTPKNNYENVGFKIIKKNNNFIFKKFYETIKAQKEKIDILKNTENWDKMKKIGNPYELIYTTYNKKKKNDSISMYIPISRSYFKMWELYYNFDFFNPNYDIDIPKNSAIFTCNSLEQIGENYKEFINFLLEKKPSLCINFEPMSELLMKKIY